MDFGEVLGFASAMFVVAEPRSDPVLPECLWAGRSALLHRCSKVTLVNEQPSTSGAQHEVEAANQRARTKTTERAEQSRVSRDFADLVIARI